jgi:crossover junction endodeoxyribonuclease RuvC
MSIILGIDPGTNITGYGIINSDENKLTYIHHEVIKTGLKNLYTTKLSLIHKNTQRLIDIYKPNEIALESVFFSVNAGTAIKLGQARGAALSACSGDDRIIYEYSPRRVKMVITGNGAADKDELQKFVKRKLRIRRKLEIDASDALGVALCHGISCINTPDEIKSI